MAHTKSKAFRLTESDVELLEYIAEKRGVNQTEAIRYALQKGADAIRSGGASGASDGTLADVIATLTEQLSAKDGQISRLQDALDAAQETAHAAQVLHAQERKALESTEQKSRWQRLREAWRG